MNTSNFGVVHIPTRGQVPHSEQPILATGDINPRLITAYSFSWSVLRRHGGRLEHRKVLDYEMECILDGSGSQVIDDTEYPVRQGDLIFRRPGQMTQGIMPYRCLTLIFDLAGRWLPRPVPYFKAMTEPEGDWNVQTNWHCPLLKDLPSIHHASTHDLYKSWFDIVLRHHINPIAQSEVIIKASILQILNQYYTDTSTPLLTGTIHSKNQLQAVILHIKQHFNRKLPLSELAEVAGLSPNHLHKVFSETFGQSPLDYIHGLRMDHARNLLATSDMAAMAVAQASGFENPTWFFTQFKKATGMTPASFREHYRFWT